MMILFQSVDARAREESVSTDSNTVSLFRRSQG
jgi:hypothetical protein